MGIQHVMIDKNGLTVLVFLRVLTATIGCLMLKGNLNQILALGLLFDAHSVRFLEQTRTLESLNNTEN